MIKWLAFVTGILLVALLIFAIYVYSLSSSNGRPVAPGWDPTNSFVLENALDTSVTTPSQPIYLTNFTNTIGAGNPRCGYAWYALRYVRPSDGGYSQLGPWSPAINAAASLDSQCEGGQCGFPQTGSCDFNLPTIGIFDALDYPLDVTYFVNVHRYVSSTNTPPSAGEAGTPIGVLVGGGPYSSLFSFTDTVSTGLDVDNGQACCANPSS